MASETSYQAIFDIYIQGAAAASLAVVRNDDQALAEADRQQAWHTLSYALAVPAVWPTAAQLLLALGPKMTHAGHWRDWTPYLERGLAQSKELHDASMEAELSLQLGHLYYRLSDMERAQSHVAHAVTLFAALRRPQRQAAALNRLAEIARQRRAFATTVQLTDNAVHLLTEAQDEARDGSQDAEVSKATLAEQGHAFLIKGRAAFNQEQWPQAAQYFAHALQQYERTADRSRIAVCTQNLGRVAYIQRDYDHAIDYYQRAASLLTLAGDVFNLAVVRMNLGIVHSLCGRPHDALAAYAQAETIFRRLEDQVHLARLFNNQGMEMNNLSQWEEAEALLQASSKLWLQLNNLQEYINAQDSLGLTYLGRKEFGDAIGVFERALAVAKAHPEQNFAQSILADLTDHLRQARRLNAVGQQQPLADNAASA